MSCRWIPLASSALLAAACHTPSISTKPPPRLAPNLSTLPRLAKGERLDLPLARLFMPTGFKPADDGRVPLFLHFQGGPTIAEENFVRTGCPGVLIASKLSGRSSAFSKPYRDPRAFAELLAEGERLLSDRAGRNIVFAPIRISFFSAGYGAVREILKTQAYYDRIEALISADSIYASIVSEQVRVPRIEQMQDFIRFAQGATRGEKTFVLAHGLEPTPYASTAETADLILAGIGTKRSKVQRYTERGVPIAAEAHVGNFHLYTFAEAGKTIHMDILYMIPELANRHLAPDQD